MGNKIILNDAFKGYTLDQDKIIPPEETLRRFMDKLKKLDLDILEKTIRIDNGRLDIPVYFSICGENAVNVIGTKKQMGKGATPIQAEASAVMELAERFSFFSFCKNPGNFVFDTFKNVKDKTIPFEMIARSVHDDASDPEFSQKIFERVRMKWTKAFNLTRKEEILIPFDWFFAINAFNGPSAGNCVEEALSQGICEIVERHVSSIISRNRLKVARINPDSPTDPMVREMIEKYRKAGVNLYLSDFTLGMGIPSVGVLAYDPSTFPEKSEIVWTAGTTPDPQKALSRALTEVAQLAGDFNTRSNYVASGLPKLKSISAAGCIVAPGNEIDISDLPDLSNDNIRVEVENCLSALSKIDLEVIVVNTTNPLLRVPAFYTIIPGAHFRERAMGTGVGMFSAKLIAENSSPQEAVRVFTEIEHLFPGRYYIKFYLGSIWLNMNDPETALQYFTAALDLEPTVQDIPSIYTYLAICLKDMGKFRQALAALEEGEKYDKERTDIYNLMGFCYFKLKEHERAIESFKKVLELDPGSAIDYANIASNYRDMGRKEAAIEYYEMALALDPKIDFAVHNLEKLLTHSNAD
jgi:ribosomal protein S12 methylthiotransferase accessory factor